jgi:hypothetical protein
MTTPTRTELDQYFEALAAGIDPELARTEIWPAPATTAAATTTTQPSPRRWTPSGTRPLVILSEVETDHPHGSIVIGWDTCFACKRTIKGCACAEGPTEPPYVTRWRPEPAKPAATPPAPPAGAVNDKAITDKAVRTTADAPLAIGADDDDPDLTPADRAAIARQKAAAGK